MASSASFGYRTGRVNRPLGWLAAVASLCLLMAGLFAQTPASHDSRPRQWFKIPSALVEAEALMNRGLLDQARDKIQEQLKRTPDSIEAYNLLGILYTNEKNYAQAQESFQHA